MSIQVYTHLLPRLIEPVSLTSISIQELVDQCRDWEDDIENMSFLKLIDAAGKEDLGGGQLVGITATLQNAQIAFDSNTTPVETGTSTSVGTTTLTDTSALFITNDIERGAVIINFDDYSLAEVLSVESEISLTHRPLENGTLNSWTIGDTYHIFNIVQCNIDGGNIVAIDDLGANIEPIFPTVFTQVIKTSSASATLQELQDIQYSSFNGGVTIDAQNDHGNAVTGTEYPTGTPRQPCLNLQDAKTIATARGFSKFFLISNITLTTGDNVDDMFLTGESHASTELVIEAGASCLNLVVKECKLSGVLDGDTSASNCLIGDLTYVNGHIHNSGLFGTIILDGNKDAVIHNCHTVDQSSPPIIDMNVSGQNLAMAHFAGLATIKNLSDASATIGIGLNSGMITLEDTITDGAIIIAGIGIAIDNTTGGTTVNLDALINKGTVADAVWDEVLTGTNRNLPTSAGRRLRTISSSIVTEGTTVSSTINTIVLNGDASTDDGAYDPAVVSIVNGTGFGQSRLILEYQGSTKTAVVDRDWKVLPDNTSEYVISGHPGREHVNEGLAQGGTINTITLNVLAASADDTYKGQNVFIRSGTGEDQVCKIIAYNGTTKVATICKDWLTIPDITSAYIMLPSGYFDADILSAKIADTVMNSTVEGAYTLEDATKLILATLVGKLSGAEGTTVTIRDINDTVDRVIATVDSNGNRTAVTHNVS